MSLCLMARRRFRTLLEGAGVPLENPIGMSGRCSSTDMLRNEGAPTTAVKKMESRHITVSISISQRVPIIRLKD